MECAELMSKAVDGEMEEWALKQLEKAIEQELLYGTVFTKNGKVMDAKDVYLTEQDILDVDMSDYKSDVEEAKLHKHINEGKN